MEDIKMKEKTRKWKMDGKYYETTDEHYKGLRKEHDLCPPSKNGHKKASKNEMNRSISLIY